MYTWSNGQILDILGCFLSRAARHFLFSDNISKCTFPSRHNFFSGTLPRFCSFFVQKFHTAKNASQILTSTCFVYIYLSYIAIYSVSFFSSKFRRKISIEFVRYHSKWICRCKSTQLYKNSHWNISSPFFIVYENEYINCTRIRMESVIPRMKSIAHYFTLIV